MIREGNRKNDELRPITLTRGYISHAEGSVLIEAGKTRVICTATVEEKVPSFLKDTGTGWVSAEYGMLPRSTLSRIPRDIWKGRASGRSYEIQRLIGRALRAVVDLPALGERTVWLDCDVIQADGGTRTTAINGAMVALVEAFHDLVLRGKLKALPLKDFVAAVSVGVLEEEELLDLDYEEDSSAEVDMNLVMTGSGSIVEIQGTAEKKPFSRETLQRLLAFGEKGIREVLNIQKDSLRDILGG